MELAVGNYLTLTSPSGGQSYRFQNFHIGTTATFDGQQYSFLPFGFSGISINRTGDNTEASLIFPNNELSRNWALQAVTERWLGTVFVMNLNPDDRTVGTKMSQCVGQVASGEWDETALTLRLNTILDAVGSDVPLRRLTQALVGNLPVTSNVRLR
jgi:phage-related protein